MIQVYCPLCCDQPFDDQDSLFHHLRSLRNNLFCPICSERFTSFDNLIKHLSRKCNGPLSPQEAKKKILCKQGKLPETLPTSSAISPTSHGPGDSRGLPARKHSPTRSPKVHDIKSSSLSKHPRKAGPLSSKEKESNSLTEKSSNNLKEDKSPDHRKSKQKDDFTSAGKTSVSKNLHRKDHESTKPLVNGAVKSKNSREAGSFVNSSDTPSNRTMKTRGKKISFTKLLDGSDSDNSVDDAYNDSDYDVEEDEEEEEPRSNIKENGDITKSKQNQDKVNSTKKQMNKIIPEDDAGTSDPNKSIATGKNSIEKDNNHKNSSLEQSKKATENIATGGSSSNDNKDDDEEEEYTCSACNIQFTSIYEHIKQYHNGQEVVVEVPEDEIKEDLKAYQDTSQSQVPTSDSALTDNPTVENDENAGVELADKAVVESDENSGVELADKAAVQNDESLTSKKSASSEPKTPGGEKRKNENEEHFTKHELDDMVEAKPSKKMKKFFHECWIEVKSENKTYHQFVRDEDKFKMLHKELRNNTTIHPEFKTRVQTLFESPKINVVEITFQTNTPFCVNRMINLKDPLPMFVVDRLSTKSMDMLGGIASYIMAGEEKHAPSEDSKLIAVMKVFLGSDREISVENLVFNEKPGNADMVPVLEDVKKPDIPLLKNAKILKWKCKRCNATTWKFPVNKDSHYCNACAVCHQTFASPVALKKHISYHKKDGTRYCKDCHSAFVSKDALNIHLRIHKTHIPCFSCRMFVHREQFLEHTEIHSRDVSEQFPCSVCKKVFGSSGDLNKHETKVCSKLVARFNCPMCDKKFFSMTALSYHRAAHDNAAIKLKCRFCPKVFLEEREQCPKKAGKRKPSSSNRKIWHERIHTRDRPYMCKSCPKRFRSLEHEGLHVARVHTGGPSLMRRFPTHVCTYCDRVFPGEKEVTEHMKQHTDGTLE